MYNQYREVVINCMKQAVCTPNKNVDTNEFVEGVIKPYRELEKLLEMIDKKRDDNPDNIGVKALNLLNKILDTKKIAKEEKIIRYNEIIDITKSNDNVYEQINDTVEKLLQIGQVR